jgi:GDPmannose 4,6-dehydratase
LETQEGLYKRTERNGKMVQGAMGRRVVVTGVLGQDGANMSEYLLRIPGYKVYGMMRRSATPNFVNINNFKNHPNFELVDGDLTDEISIDRLIQKIYPDYFINFGANSYVGCSWDMPLQVFDANSLGVLRCLEAIRKFHPSCRFYSAGSSEEFGNVDYCPQDMKHPIKPRSPYGASKAAARHLVKVYRESYDLYAVHGILFNHEGIRRGEEFVTRKITKGVAAIHKHLEDAASIEAPPFIQLGNLDAKRDWSDSEDFVDGIWLMMNQKEPKDYILASGEAHSIREFVERAFTHAGIEGYWHGIGVKERYIYKGSTHGHSLVEINEKFYRPAEVELLMGDPSETIEEIGWQRKHSFDDLVKKMVKHDIELLK